MAGVVSRSLQLVRSGTSRRALHVTAATRRDMPDAIDHATGLEKYELLAKQAGNDDPFFLRATSRSVGTKEEPTIVDAMDTYRMIGCVCNDEDTNIKWMWLCEGSPKRCECGYWFSLKVHPGPEKYTLPL
eukprot:TRINITY_DN33416_c0_g2_i1.p1 TRINITY_DN33416_c0_g2~~TRINITY_DN33416_c0_g2_i1.p1  ORF type:complete len:130 (+),score=48.29 TRINITY_DN33416_c0_g2_i1:42-431(+)